MRTPSIGIRSPSVTFALAGSALLGSLGVSVVTVALPSLAEEFSTPASAVQGVVIAYLLAATVTVIVAGKRGDALGFPTHPPRRLGHLYHCLRPVRTCSHSRRIGCGACGTGYRSGGSDGASHVDSQGSGGQRADWIGDGPARHNVGHRHCAWPVPWRHPVVRLRMACRFFSYSQPLE